MSDDETGGQRSPEGVRWRIDPGRGVGPLRIGMPMDAAIRALDSSGQGPVERSEKASVPVYASRGWSILIYPAVLPAAVAPDTVDQIELLPPAQVELLGRPLLGVPLANAGGFLLDVDSRTERHGYLIEAPGLGIRVWSGGGPGWPISSVSVNRPRPPALVVSPDFSFTEIDQVVRTLGFAGGAVTLRAPLLAGEPEVAEWTRRHVLLRYTFDPVTLLRVLYLDGGEAVGVPAVQKLVARLPQLSEGQVLADMGSTDEVTCLRAIQAVSVLRLAAARDRLVRLSQHAQVSLRTAAIRTLINLPDPIMPA
ncbi:hypothetical protein [Arthrobacter humicola]